MGIIAIQFCMIISYKHFQRVTSLSVYVQNVAASMVCHSLLNMCMAILSSFAENCKSTDLKTTNP